MVLQIRNVEIMEILMGRIFSNLFRNIRFNRMIPPIKNVEIMGNNSKEISFTNFSKVPELVQGFRWSEM